MSKCAWMIFFFPCKSLSCNNKKKLYRNIQKIRQSTFGKILRKMESSGDFSSFSLPSLPEKWFKILFSFPLIKYLKSFWGTVFHYLNKLPVFGLYHSQPYIFKKALYWETSRDLFNNSDRCSLGRSLHYKSEMITTYKYKNIRLQLPLKEYKHDPEIGWVSFTQFVYYLKYVFNVFWSISFYSDCALTFQWNRCESLGRDWNLKV